jgi:hypothetical protein
MTDNIMTPTKKYIFAQLDAISKKYGDMLVYTRNRDYVHLDLLNLYNDVGIFWGKKHARKLFKECLIQYCGFYSGAALYKELFNFELKKGV